MFPVFLLLIALVFLAASTLRKNRRKAGQPVMAEDRWKVIRYIGELPVLAACFAIVFSGTGDQRAKNFAYVTMGVMSVDLVKGED